MVTYYSANILPTTKENTTASTSGHLSEATALVVFFDNMLYQGALAMSSPDSTSSTYAPTFHPALKASRC